MNLNFIYDPSARNAPASFLAGLQAAAAALDGLIWDPVTVNIRVGWGEVADAPVSGLAEGGPLGSVMSYAQVVTQLTRFATSNDDTAILRYLPAEDPTGGGGFFVAYSQQKAWGILQAGATEVDGNIGFAADQPFTFDPNNRAVPGAFDFIATAEHEITHAMGRFASDLQNPAGLDTVMDLFRYTSTGVLATSLSQSAYFSLDGGATALLPFDVSGADASDWTSAVQGDAFGWGSMDAVKAVSATDSRLMDVLGFNVGATGPPVVSQPGLATFMVTDTTTGQSGPVDGQAYEGVMPGIVAQLIEMVPDSLIIGSVTPNVFIYAGIGDHNIYLGNNSGNNILEASRGSDLLTGGSGLTTFMVDDINTNGESTLWTTINNFHAGDNVLVWGVVATDFRLAWTDGNGNPGYTGLTLEAVAPNKPDAFVTIAGFSQADFGNGRLTVSFAGQDGAAPYLAIQGH